MPASLLLLALAVPAAAEGLLASRPAAALVHEVVELKPAAGHHFELKAPQICASRRPDLITPKTFRCQLKEAGRAEFVVSVCDDAKTFCRQERFAVEVAGAAPRAGRAKAEPRRRAHAAPPGFLLDRPDAALARAKKRGEPLFVHFFGIWCPPCNMLEETVYPSDEFAAASKGFVTLALDADAEVSWPWKARYKVGGYPTLLVLDPRGRELDRAVGYRSPAALAAFLARAKTHASAPIEEVARSLRAAKPDARGADRARVARWRHERLEWRESEAAAGNAPEARRWLLLSRKERGAREDDPALILSALKDLTTEFRGDPEFPYWAADLAERDKAAGAALADAARVAAGRWAADASLGEHGLVPGDEFAALASLYEALGREAEAKAAWGAAADAFAEQAKLSRLASARGANLERAYCLLQAGRPADSLELYEAMAKAYPDEFTFHYGRARALLDLKRAADALDPARKAAAAAYGDNWLRAVGLEAKVLTALDRKPEAAKALDAALGEAAAPASTAVRTHRYLAELRKLRAAL